MISQSKNVVSLISQIWPFRLEIGLVLEDVTVQEKRRRLKHNCDHVTKGMERLNKTNVDEDF